MRVRFIAAIVALAASAAAFAQQPAVTLNLRCPSPCTFRQGESIWLNLDFTATASNNNLRVLTNYTDREMAREEFVVAPQEGVSDPLLPYLTAIKPSAGSFHFVREPLSKSPVTVRLNLNQFVSFDQPGSYQVSVTSRRAADLSKLGVVAAVPVHSSPVTLHITAADPQWQKQQLERILRVVDRLDLAIQPPDEIRDLCNLNTEEAEIEIARRVGAEKRFFFLYEFGLLRSRYRAEGVREMRRLLADPVFPVTDLFLAALQAAARLDPATGTLAPYEAGRASLREELRKALPNKRGAARATSEAALQQFR